MLKIFFKVTMVNLQNRILKKPDKKEQIYCYDVLEQTKLQ